LIDPERDRAREDNEKIEFSFADHTAADRAESCAFVDTLDNVRCVRKPHPRPDASAAFR